MKQLIITAILMVSATFMVKGQVDPHFSQYYAFPLWLNPALTGVVDGSARVTANYRNQWTGMSNGYQTAAISADVKVSDKIALGLNVFDQKAGTAGYNYLAAYGSFAYQLPISANTYHKLNFGLQAGLINRGIDLNKLQFDDQYNPLSGYDPGMSSAEHFASSSAAVFDANAGLFYYDGTPSAKVNVFGGMSVAHLTRPKDPFVSQALEDKIPMRYNVHAGLRISVAEFMDLTPHLIYIRQKKNEIAAAGLNMEFGLNPETSLTIGGMYRRNDAAIGSLALNLKNLIVGVSYDYTTSALQQSANVRGGYEISLSYVFKRNLSGRSQICPRL